MLRSRISVLLASLFLVLSVGEAQQPTGRTMNVLFPPVLGLDARFGLTYPSSAAGNPYAFLWSTPQSPGVTTLLLPGITVNGLVRVDLANAFTAFSGVLNPVGGVEHTVRVPNDQVLIGYSWDLQSVDAEIGGTSLTFADNKLELEVVGAVVPNMILIAPGSFQMGSTLDFREQPVHVVVITRPFWIGAYEVTQAEWQAVMGTSPSHFTGLSHPVEQVSWEDALAYCNALTAVRQVPSGYQYRLPTEAEWEYCCRASTTTEWNVGSSLSCGQVNFGYGSCGVSQTTNVGSYPANAWGLHDTHGNVSEWCLDAWDGTANYPSNPVSDPYLTSGPDRINRGGGWASSAFGCRSALRSRNDSNGRFNDVGFRVVLAPVLVP